MPVPAWIGADWGSTHLRVWVLDANGAVMAEHAAATGAHALAPDGYEPALMALIGDLLPEGSRAPVLICGTAGSREGWAETGYAAVPCAPSTAGRAVAAPSSDPRVAVRILPGLSQAKPADTMRGEETQIAGYLAAEPRFDGILCLTGTETKWAHISAGEVVSFRTWLTGSVYGYLAHASVLRHGIDPDGWDADAFSVAVGDAMARPQAVAAELAGLRARFLLDGLDPGAGNARLSGLLIGMELAGARPYWLGQRVVVVGEGRMSQAYAQALAAQGAMVETARGTETALAGLRVAARALGIA
jgi:2-dehydro-3-deoxygalactonokinase